MKNTLIEIKDWEKYARCGTAVDPDLWFVIDDDRKSEAREVQEAEAKAFCKRCPVSGNCLDRAFQNNELFGVWGGMNPDERRATKRGGSRLSCPRCTGRVTTKDERSQVCLLCGLSWLL